MARPVVWSEARVTLSAEHAAVGASGIGAALRRIREKLRVSLASVARRAGISDAMLSRIERGERQSPHFTTVAKIAVVLGVSLDEIAREAGIPVALPRTLGTPQTDAHALRRAEELEIALRYLDRVKQQIERAKEE